MGLACGLLGVDQGLAEDFLGPGSDDGVAAEVVPEQNGMLLDLAAEGRWPPIRFVRRTSMLVLIRLKLTCSGSPWTGNVGAVPSGPAAAGWGSASSGRGRFAAQAVGRIEVQLKESWNGATWSSGTPSPAAYPLRQTDHSSGEPHRWRLRAVSSSMSR
ncbi:hypothetical protein [Streptomyces sp. NPDC006463]|uniref:hypothetical protein n=1 Tax=Streptomyces sp. NPDC006463 TaxID=3364746 RepID=UPI0036C13E7D